MSLILAIDPGLAKGGWALFEPPAESVATLQGYGPCLRGSGAWATKPDSSPNHVQIRGALPDSRALGDAWPAKAVLKTPAIFGPYKRRGPNRRQKALSMAESMGMLWYVIGRIESWLALTGSQIIRIKAASVKADHHALVQKIWPHLPTTKTGPAEDQRHAVWLGLRYLTDHPRPTRSDGRLDG